MTRPAPQVPLISKPHLVALTLMTLCAWLLWSSESQAKKRQSNGPRVSLPSELGPWQGMPLAVEQRTIEILETEDVSLMEYHVGEEPPVWFAKVDGFGNRAAFHPPELCYVGSHYEVLERGPIEVVANGKPHRLMRLVLSQGRDRFEAWYWFTAGDRVTPSYYQQQGWLLLDAIHRQPMSGALVRISTPLDTPSRAHRRLLAFVTSWDTVQHQTTGHGG